MSYYITNFCICICISFQTHKMNISLVDRQATKDGTIIIVPPNTLYKLTKLYQSKTTAVYVGDPDLFLMKEEDDYSVLEVNNEKKYLFFPRGVDYWEHYLPDAPLRY